MSLQTRLFRAIGALIVVLAVVVGGPVALIWFGRLDVFAQIDWTQLLTTRDEGSLVLGLITVIGWIAWGLAALSVVSEVLAVLSGQRWRIRLPGLGLFAPTSAVLVTAIVGLVSAQLVAPAATASAAPTAERLATTPAPLAVTAPATPAKQAPNPIADPEVTHLVQIGDDLWSLAERYYQDGTQWRLIAEANQTTLMNDTDHLTPGMVLVIPGPVPTTTDDTRPITVQPGDTLSALAATHLGDADRWPELATANADLVRDPDAIEVGWELRLPAAEEDAQPASSTDQSDSDPAPEVQTAQTEPSEQAPVGDGSVESPVSDPSSTESPVTETSAVEPSASDPALSGGLTTCPADTPSATQTVSVEEASSTWVGVLGLGLAGAVAAAFGLRRRQQAAQRPLGRRLPALPYEALDASIEMAHALDAHRASNPQGGAAGSSAVAPAEVTIGEDDGGPMTCDLEGNVITRLAGDDGDDLALAAAIALGLVYRGADDDDQADGPVAPPVEVVVAGAGLTWLESLDEPQLTILDSVADGETLIAQTAAWRADSLPEGAIATDLRADATMADAWAPLVVILAGEPAAEPPLGLGLLGISVVICQGGAPLRAQGATIEVDADQARNLVTGQVFRPHLVAPPARRAMTEIFAVANQTDYPAAPWWDESPDSQAPTVLHPARTTPVEELAVTATVQSDHPVVHLLGTLELTGARGAPPSRAAKQCAEYCAWLLENPGASSLAMARALGVAEPTRRSNMSRLRSWLGGTDDGSPYLPEAYSGRIELHPGVTSDWEQLQIYISGGANRVGDAALVQALGLVRGAPLADSAPGQWNWAEQLRADMVAAIRDIGVVLARRALARGDHDLARWAITRAQLAAPDDPLLIGCQILLAHRSGHRPEVDRLVMQVTRRARNLGVDLPTELVVLLQEVVEGRARQRA